MSFVVYTFTRQNNLKLSQLSHLLSNLSPKFYSSSSCPVVPIEPESGSVVSVVQYRLVSSSLHFSSPFHKLTHLISWSFKANSRKVTASCVLVIMRRAISVDLLVHFLYSCSFLPEFPVSELLTFGSRMGLASLRKLSCSSSVPSFDKYTCETGCLECSLARSVWLYDALHFYALLTNHSTTPTPSTSFAIISTIHLYSTSLPPIVCLPACALCFVRIVVRLTIGKQVPALIRR